MRTRLKHAVRRAKYAVVGAALGAGVGGLFSRNAASTLAGIGALVGATVADKTGPTVDAIGKMKSRRAERE